MIQIKEVTDNKALDIFLEFPNTLYKDCPQYVPEFKQDVKNMLNPAKNPALKFSLLTKTVKLQAELSALSIREQMPSGNPAMYDSAT